jgi:phosphoribosylglycinamide formyltransferase 1
MNKIAVFASGSGTNFQSFIDAVESNECNIKIVLLVCDKPDAKAVERAEKAGIPTFVFSPKNYETKSEFEEEIVQKLQQKEVDFVVLAGYMRLIGSTLLKAYEGKIVNIHPSLLPSFPGKDAVGQALAAGVKLSGVTIHYVDEGMDTGPIIAQEAVEITEDDTHESLQAKIQEVEHRLYPKTINKILTTKCYS